MTQSLDIADLATFSSTPPLFDDFSILKRMAKYAKRADDCRVRDFTSFWNSIVSQHKDEILRMLVRGDYTAAGEALRNPAQTMFHYGFEHLVKEFSDAIAIASKSARASQAQLHVEKLNLLAESLGAGRLRNPEAQSRDISYDIEDILKKIDVVLGEHVDFPSPFPGEYGLGSTRGVISYRSLQSVYQAACVKGHLKTTRGARVLEIGGGLGRTAYYANRFGIRDYTIVDIPTSGIAQANFLGRVLGERAISLEGEDLRRDTIKIVTPDFIRSETEYYDVILNVDSLTELGEEMAGEYVDFVRSSCSTFISINHEANHFTVRDLLHKNGINCMRFPYWMRSGYVAEISRF